MRRDAPPIDRVAGVAHRLAVLLAAGIPPAAAWRHLAGLRQDPILAPVVAAAASAAEDGGDVAAAIARAATAALPAGRSSRERRRRSTRAVAAAASAAPAWEALAAVWSVATDLGAPLASSLRVTAESFRAAGRLHREARIALAGPRATARLMAVLPLVSLLFSALLGFDPVGTMIGSGAGWACAVAGGLLLGAGHAWSMRMVRRAERIEEAPGLAIDLTAIGLSGGASVVRARQVAGIAARRLARLDVGLLAAAGERIDDVLELAKAAGVPAAELLHAEADDERLQARSDGQERVARLSVALMLPLGCCTLPAFMLLGVAPMLLSVVSSTLRPYGAL